MGLPEQVWKKMKEAARTRREVVYALDDKGKEIRFRPSPPKIHLHTKHEASKRGFQHLVVVKKIVKKSRLTNNERLLSVRKSLVVV
jgi:hypothetical protein